MSINFLILLSFFSLEFLINFSFWSTCPSSPLFSENVGHRHFNILAWELQGLHHLESVSFFLKYFFMIFEHLTLSACLRIKKKNQMLCMKNYRDNLCSSASCYLCPERSKNRSPLPRLGLRWINANKSVMQYLDAVSKTTEWSLFVSKASHSISQ